MVVIWTSLIPGLGLGCVVTDNSLDGVETEVITDTVAAAALDQDRDGFNGAFDCNDNDPAIFPGAIERCDGFDNDCDGTTDIDAVDGFPYFIDNDGDGYGNQEESLNACSLPQGYADNLYDCDDTDPELNPETIWYTDRDNDDYGDGIAAVQCGQPSQSSRVDGDCDDQDRERNPGAPEICDNFDNDCNGLTDDDPIDPKLFFADLDGDGYGDPDNIVESCWLGEGFGTDSSDCDDSDNEVSPAADEVCSDDIDHDCSGRPDNTCYNEVTDNATLYFDGDNERYFGSGLANIGDLDGDGDEELLLGSSYAVSYSGIAYVVAGGTEPEDIDDAAIATLGSGDLTYFGYTVVALPDVDGDSQADFGVYATSYGSCWSCGTLAVFSGMVEGNLDTGDADLVMSGVDNYAQFGLRTVGGDLTGDGIDDLLVSAPGANSWSGAVYLFEGPATSESEPPATYHGGTSEYAGYDLGEPVDFNGDGFGDLVVGTPYASSSDGSVTVTYGPIEGDYDAKTVDIEITGSSRDYFGLNLQTGGDLDGDGHPDLIVASNSSTAEGVYIFSQPPAAADPGDALAFVEPERWGNVGASLDVADMDGDGKDDLLVNDSSNSAVATGGGAVFMFYGHLGGHRTFGSADIIYFGDDDYSYFGRAASFVDFNGDGLADVAGTQGSWDTSYSHGLYLFEQ